MSDYCEKCNILLLGDKERKVDLCKYCIEKLPKIRFTAEDKLILFDKDYFKKVNE